MLLSAEHILLSALVHARHRRLPAPPPQSRCWWRSSSWGCTLQELETLEREQLALDAFKGRVHRTAPVIDAGRVAGALSDGHADYVLSCGSLLRMHTDAGGACTARLYRKPLSVGAPQRAEACQLCLQTCRRSSLRR